MTDIDGKWIRDGTITMKDRVVFLKINDGSMVYIMDPKEEEEVMFFHLFHYILFQTVVLMFLTKRQSRCSFCRDGLTLLYRREAPFCYRGMRMRVCSSLMLF